MLKQECLAEVEAKAISLAENQGCTPTLEYVVACMVRFIEAKESSRGDIARKERSHLADDAAACQDILDKILLTLLGLGVSRHGYIKQRLTEML